MLFRTAISTAALLLPATCSAASVRSYVSRASEPDPKFQVNATLAGQTFINKGMVAFGLIPSNATDSTGDTIGGIGSAIAIKLGSFKQGSDGTFSGTLIVQPDRGFNVITTINYQARQHEIDFVLNPYYGDADLSFSQALQTLQVTYRDTLLYTEVNGTKTSGLDALGIRPPQGIFPSMPIANLSFNHLDVDAEGLVLNADGTFWTSDEYGPYIHRFSAQGDLLLTIAPPAAILPMQNGKLNFTASEDPDTGRAANQGFEALTVSPDGSVLYAMLQSATIQDGGNKKSNSRFTRMLAYSIPTSVTAQPTLIGEWVVPLPQDSSGDTIAQSEMHFLSDTTFLVLSRDGGGHGGSSSNTSSYKQADLIDISKATDVHGSKFDDPSNPLAPKGKLDKSITPATYVSFVSFIDPTQLARFGLHNGNPGDQTLIDAKWESLALAPVDDPAFPDDYFLFTAADNDFITTMGISLGVPYNAGLNNDNQFMVFRVTLPSVAQGSVQQALGI